MKLKLNRWVYAVVGVIVLVFAGLVYAWSVLSVPIAKEFPEWTKGQLSMTFTLAMSFFCIGGFVGGLVAGKINVKINVWVSAVLFLIGFLVASMTQSLAMLYIGFGVLAGFASGLAYNAVMSTMSKWFPDKQGLISGILLMGFGIGSFIIGKVYQALTPAEVGGWRISFRVFAVILFVVILICGFFFVKPGDDFVPPAAAKAKKVSKNKVEGLDISTVQMIKRPSFWFYFIWAIVLSAAGLILVSQASGFVAEVSPEVSENMPGTVATVVGLISVFNGLGRVLFGGMFDRIGSKVMLLVDCVFVVFIAVAFLAFGMHSFPILVVAFILGGLAYSGITPTNSAFINAYYGPTHYPVNFSIVNLNLIIASFGGTLAGTLYDMTHTYVTSLYVMIGAVVVGFICTFAIRKP